MTFDSLLRTPLNFLVLNSLFAPMRRDVILPPDPSPGIDPAPSPLPPDDAPMPPADPENPGYPAPDPDPGGGGFNPFPGGPTPLPA